MSPSTGSVRTAPKDIRSLRAENDELKAKVEELTRRLETKEFNMRAMNFHMTGGRSALKLKASKSEVAMMKATEQECLATVDVMASWMHTVVWPQKKFLSPKWANWNEKRNTLCERVMRKIGHCVPPSWDRHSFWIVWCTDRIKKLYKEKRANTSAVIKKLYIGEQIRYDSSGFIQTV